MKMKKKLFTKDCGECRFHQEIQLNSGEPCDICKLPSKYMPKLLIKPYRYIHCGYFQTGDKMISEFAKKIFPHYAERIDAGRCPFCDKPVGEFRDKLSEDEFKISGLCQACQDETFGK